MDKGEGVEKVRIVCRHRRGVNFSRFFTDVFYGLL